MVLSTDGHFHERRDEPQAGALRKPARFQADVLCRPDMIGYD